MADLTLEEEQAIKQRCQKTNAGKWEGGLTMYDCPVCLKHFCIHNESMWVYKRKNWNSKRKNRMAILYLCSYACMRKYDRIFDK